jgi:hypothetical protein
MRTQPVNTIHLYSGAHGAYECTPLTLDFMIAEYGHLSVLALQDIAEEIAGVPHGYYRFSSCTEGFMILAELRGYATN